MATNPGPTWLSLQTLNVQDVQALASAPGLQRADHMFVAQIPRQGPKGHLCVISSKVT